MYAGYQSPANIPSNIATGRQAYGYRPAQPSGYGQVSPTSSYVPGGLPPGVRPPPGAPPASNYVAPGVRPPPGPPPASNYVVRPPPGAPPASNYIGQGRPRVLHTEELKLFETTREREEHDNNAEFYAIVVATEHLEKAYVRGIISDGDYSTACTKLIAQYRTALSLVRDPDSLIKKYGLET